MCSFLLFIVVCKGDRLVDLLLVHVLFLVEAGSRKRRVGGTSTWGVADMENLTGEKPEQQKRKKKREARTRHTVCKRSIIVLGIIVRK